MLGVGVGWYEGEQCGGGGWEMGWIWIRDPQSSIAERLYRCSGPAGVLMCTNWWSTAQMAAQKDSPRWNFTCRQATAVSGLLGPSQVRKQTKQNDQWKRRCCPFTFHSVALCWGVFIEDETKLYHGCHHVKSVLLCLFKALLHKSDLKLSFWNLQNRINRKGIYSQQQIILLLLCFSSDINC